MAGLLDSFGDWAATPGGQGLLTAVAAGLAGARRGAPINSIGAGLMGGLQGYSQAQDQQMQQKRFDQQGKLFDAQMQNYQAEADTRKAALEQAQRKQSYLGSIGKVTSPMVDAKPNEFNPMQALGYGFSPQEAQVLAGAKDWGKPKVARTIEGTDAQGNKVTRQFDDYGNEVGGGVNGYVAPVQVDLGGKVMFVKPQGGVTLGKTMTPGEADSSKRGWASIKLQENNQTKPEFKDGQWVTPPRDMKPGEVRTITGGQQAKDANDALSLIGQARDILPNATGSYAGAGYDQAMRFFGQSTDGALASAKLKAIGGALVSKMPKMSGPQSDKDVAMYREMAGRVGDETLPISERSAALDAVEEIQSRYASGQGGAPVPRPAPTKNPSGLQFLGFE